MIAFIYDTETTGLVKNSLIPLASQPHIIEFFGHLVDDQSGEIINEIEFFCHPGVPFDLSKIRQGDNKSITQITGIRNEDLNGKPTFKFYAIQILEALAKADAVVAHNLSFDMALVEYEIIRSEICLQEGRIPWPSRLICTVEQTEWIKGHRLSLGALHEELFGEPFKDAHRARNDVQALTKCYLELRKRGDL